MGNFRLVILDFPLTGFNRESSIPLLNSPAGYPTSLLNHLVRDCMKQGVAFHPIPVHQGHLY